MLPCSPTLGTPRRTFKAFEGQPDLLDGGLTSTVLYWLDLVVELKLQVQTLLCIVINHQLYHLNQFYNYIHYEPPKPVYNTAMYSHTAMYVNIDSQNPPVIVRKLEHGQSHGASKKVMSQASPFCS